MTKSSPEPGAAWQPPDLTQSDDARRLGLDTPFAEEAYHRGRRDGEAAARQELERTAHEAQTAFHGVMNAMAMAVATLRSEQAGTLHALSIAIAKHLVERELATDPAEIGKMVNRALTLAPLSGPVVVRVHPDDLAVLQQQGATRDLAAGLDLRWLPDVATGRGGCVIETPASIIDGRIDRALLDLYERLTHD